MNFHIFPLGDDALTIDFGAIISSAVNDKVHRLADYINHHKFAGFVETVPAYASLTIFYNISKVRKAFENGKTSFENVKDLVEKAINQTADNTKSEPRTVEIPVCYDAEFAPDIEFVAALNNLSASEVITLHIKTTYRVFMIGFLPGFPYLGEVDERIAAPRKSEPRLRVAKGSVGIAGRQTGIYPLESPGGWQIIGRTPLELFNPQADAPTLLQSGDLVRFKAIDKDIYATL